MPRYLTEGKFEECMRNLQTDLQKFATKEDTKRELEAVENRLSSKIENDLGGVEKRLGKKFDDMTQDLDTYLRRTETWYIEQTSLTNRVKRLETTLVRKNVLSENDLIS